MNTYKLKDIVGYIRSLGKLPMDVYDQRLSVEQLMEWFGLAESLTVFEQRNVKKELVLMIEAELYIESVKHEEQLSDFS